MESKCCPKCERLLSIKEFSKNRSTKDGLQSWCRACKASYCATHKAETAAYMIIYRAEHKKEAADYQATYRQTPNGRAKVNAGIVRYRIKHPQREHCRRQLRDAIAAGKIKRQSCVNGCKAKSEGHHLNYQKPFAVIWLCRECHKRWHSKSLNQDFLYRMNEAA